MQSHLSLTSQSLFSVNQAVSADPFLQLQNSLIDYMKSLYDHFDKIGELDNAKDIVSSLKECGNFAALRLVIGKHLISSGFDSAPNFFDRIEKNMLNTRVCMMLFALGTDIKKDSHTFQLALSMAVEKEESLRKSLANAELEKKRTWDNFEKAYRLKMAILNDPEKETEILSKHQIMLPEEFKHEVEYIAKDYNNPAAYWNLSCKEQEEATRTMDQIQNELDTLTHSKEFCFLKAARVFLLNTVQEPKLTFGS